MTGAITSAANRPLVTLILYALNEEAYVGEAVSSLLAQDYEPLEIILSDDASTDRTYAIMQELVAAYTGPHRVLLNRLTDQTGICAQLNAAVVLSAGDLILLANGDDRSYPDRVSRTVAAWEASGRRASLIASPLAPIDAEGVPIRNWLVPSSAVYPDLMSGLEGRFRGVGQAASVALRRDVFSGFPPLMPSLILEDSPLAMRAFLIGEFYYLESPVVMYRVHGENISQVYQKKPYEDWRRAFFGTCLWQCRESVKAYTQMLSDLFTSAASPRGGQDLPLARLIAIEKLYENELFRQYYESAEPISLSRRWRGLRQLVGILLKITLKTWIPQLRERDARNQYERQFRKNGLT